MVCIQPIAGRNYRQIIRLSSTMSNNYKGIIQITRGKQIFNHYCPIKKRTQIYGLFFIGQNDSLSIFIKFYKKAQKLYN